MPPCNHKNLVSGDSPEPDLYETFDCLTCGDAAVQIRFLTPSAKSDLGGRLVDSENAENESLPGLPENSGPQGKRARKKSRAIERRRNRQVVAGTRRRSKRVKGYRSRERQLGLDPNDAASRWLTENDPGASQ